MRCPECHIESEPGSAACGNCGLLLIAVQPPAPPKRRAEDFAVQKRRAADRDQPNAECPFCAGAIPSNAIRCMHCSEIVNEDYYRERAQRTRARINYASWVAYLFGLAALVVFRPVDSCRSAPDCCSRSSTTRFRWNRPHRAARAAENSC